MPLLNEKNDTNGTNQNYIIAGVAILSIAATYLGYRWYFPQTHRIRNLPQTPPPQGEDKCE